MVAELLSKGGRGSRQERETERERARRGGSDGGEMLKGRNSETERSHEAKAEARKMQAAY